MSGPAFAVRDGLRSARLGWLEGRPLFWPAAAPECNACRSVIEFEDAHSYELDGRIVLCHKDCCPVCEAPR